MTEGKIWGLVPWRRKPAEDKSEVSGLALMLSGAGKLPAEDKPTAEDKPKVSGLAMMLSGTDKPPAPLPSAPRASSAAVKPAERPRLVFALDLTASRAAALEAAKKVTERLFDAVPGELDVAFAGHGGGRVHTFTPYLPDAEPLRKIAAEVRCKAGYTKLLPILQRAGETGAAVVVYIGDAFEEDEGKALRCAEVLKLRGTQVIILHDMCSGGYAGEVFRAIAERTGGAVLPFDISALESLGELLEAVAVLAVGGVELVEKKQETMPGATLLLEHLGAAKRIKKG